MLGGGVIDMLGVASIMPFIAVLSNPGIVQTNAYLKWGYETFAFASVTDYMRFLALVFLGLLVLTLAYRAMSTWILSRFTQMREYSIGHELVRRYLGQPYDWFMSRHSADLGKSIMNQVSRVVGSVIIPLVQLVVQGAIVLSLLTLLLLVDHRMAISLGIAFIACYVSIYLLQRSYLRRIGENLERANQARFRIVNEAFSGVKSAKVSGLEMHYAAAFARPAYDYARNIAASNLATMIPRLALELLAFGGMLGMIFFTIGDSSFQQMLPLLSVYGLASYRLMPAMQQAYLAVATLRVAGPVLESLHAEYVSLRVPAPPDKGPRIGLVENIRLDNISYRYPGAGKMNIAGIDMTIKACTSIGIVGPTGSGKTTTVDIILGLLQAAGGRLLVDGVEIGANNLARWQKSIGYVPQQIFLIDDTVAANIAYGTPREQIDMQAVTEAARIANLHDFVINEMPHGYDTMVGERGVRLSGGQVQRIGIARALYRNPALLVLDEATSALDNLTEIAVMDAISNLRYKLTMVIVAHRLSTVRDCDCIYVMERGRISDCGSFDELSSRSGRFRDMVQGSARIRL
jgi:ABC-type multidrug transport system fused ATPase/permease subunit